jgi:hypothetical protein
VILSQITNRLVLHQFNHKYDKEKECDVNIPVNFPPVFGQVMFLKTGERTNGGDGVLPAGGRFDYLRGKDTDRG